MLYEVSVSQGKSLLPSEVVVPLQVMEDSINYQEIISEIQSRPDMMDRFRRYLTILRHIQVRYFGRLRLPISIVLFSFYAFFLLHTLISLNFGVLSNYFDQKSKGNSEMI